MKTKTFDCVEMKRQGAEKVQQRLEGMTLAEQAAYWRRASEALRERRQGLAKRHSAE